MMTPDGSPTHGEDIGGHGRTIFHHPSVNRATASLANQDGSRPKAPNSQTTSDGRPLGSHRVKQGPLNPPKSGAPRPVDNGYGG